MIMRRKQTDQPEWLGDSILQLARQQKSLGSAFGWDWNKPRDLSWEEHRNKAESTGKNADHNAGDTGRWHWPVENCGRQ